MPRPPRLELADAVYHVMSRGNARKAIFFDDDDRRRFLRQLDQNLQTYDVALFGYVLMPNHFHLLIRTRRPNLARFMQRLNTSYALCFRYKHHAPGHVLQGRYKAILVEADAYLLPLSRYIHLNPLRTTAARRLAPAAHRRLLETYPWSSYRGYVDRKAAEERVRYDLLPQFGRSDAAARRHYRAYVVAGLTEDDGPLLEAMRNSRHAVGSAAFVRDIERQFDQQRTGGPADRDVALPRRLVDVEQIVAAVAREYGVAADDLRRHGHRAGPAKTVAIELACRLTMLNQREIGERFGGITSMAVCMARRRLASADRADAAASLATVAKLERKLVSESTK
jgi:putative transposase